MRFLRRRQKMRTQPTVMPEPACMETRGVSVSDQTVLLLLTVDTEQPSSVQLTLVSCVLPASSLIREEILVTSLAVEVLPLRQWSARDRHGENCQNKNFVEHFLSGDYSFNVYWHVGCGALYVRGWEEIRWYKVTLTSGNRNIGNSTLICYLPLNKCKYKTYFTHFHTPYYQYHFRSKVRK